MTGKGIFAFVCDVTCVIFDGETKISAGKEQKQGRELELSRETNFLGGDPSTLAVHRFSGVVTEGVYIGNGGWRVVISS